MMLLLVVAAVRGVHLKGLVHFPGHQGLSGQHMFVACQLLHEDLSAQHQYMLSFELQLRMCAYACLHHLLLHVAACGRSCHARLHTCNAVSWFELVLQPAAVCGVAQPLAAPLLRVSWLQ
jgi:hypothetical protein